MIEFEIPTQHGLRTAKTFAESARADAQRLVSRFKTEEVAA
jgi:hypothetical protein